MFLPLDSYIEKAQFMEWDKLTPVVMDAGRTEKGQFLLPMTYTVPAVAFRRSDVEHTPSKDMKWEDMLLEGPHISLAAVGGIDYIGNALAPVADYEVLNNYSVTVKLVHGQNSFLFTGDIESEAETDILDSGADVSADVLKVAHHGSTTSSLKKFLNAVSPDYAVIEVGSPNDYGHPHEKTVERLENMGIAVYRTDIRGNIVFVSDGEELGIEVEREAA